MQVDTSTGKKYIFGFNKVFLSVAHDRRKRDLNSKRWLNFKLSAKMQINLNRFLMKFKGN